jgi:hypothetical protein
VHSISLDLNDLASGTAADHLETMLLMYYLHYESIEFVKNEQDDLKLVAEKLEGD